MGYNIKENNPMWEKHRSKEFKEKMRRKYFGRKLTKEWKRKISIANKGKRHPVSNDTREKISKAHKGEKNYNWKGKIKTTAGYIIINQHNHPFCSKRGYIAEHRLVMEQILNRYLKPQEKVHHINGIKSDNRPENLHLYILGKNWHPCLCPKCGFEFLIK